MGIKKGRGNMKNMFSSHFSLRECEQSPIAQRLGIDNTLPSVYYMNAMDVAKNILEPVRKQYGIPFTPTSWFRSYTLNEAIKGSKSSQHCTASAVDFEIPGIPNLEVALWMRDNLEFDQLILEYYTGGSTGWIHCSYAQNNRNQTKRFDGKGYKQGLIDS